MNEYCTTGSNVKTDSSLIRVQQNIRGTVSKTHDIIGSFRMDKINPQVFVFHWTSCVKWKSVLLILKMIY